MKNQSNIGKKFNDAFFGDRPKKALTHVWKDIAKPTFRELLFEIITGGAHVMLFDDDRQVPRRGAQPVRFIHGSTRNTFDNHTSYSSAYGNNVLYSNTGGNTSVVSTNCRLFDRLDNYCFAFINLATYKKVTGILYSQADEYGFISVGGFYGIIKSVCSDDKEGVADITQLLENYSACNGYGWTVDEIQETLSKPIRRTRECGENGVLLDMPTPHALN